MKGLVRMAVVWGAVRFAVSKQALQEMSRPDRKDVKLLLAYVRATGRHAEHKKELAGQNWATSLGNMNKYPHNYPKPLCFVMVLLVGICCRWATNTHQLGPSYWKTHTSEVGYLLGICLPF